MIAGGPTILMTSIGGIIGAGQEAMEDPTGIVTETGTGSILRDTMNLGAEEDHALGHAPGRDLDRGRDHDRIKMDLCAAGMCREIIDGAIGQMSLMHHPAAKWRHRPHYRREG